MRHAALLLCVIPSVAFAQVPSMVVGARLRVDQVAATRVEGTLMAQTSDSLTMASVGALRTLIPSANVMKIQVSEGKKASAGFFKGAKVGAVIGVATGLLLAAAVNDVDGSTEGVGGMVAYMTFSTAVWGGGIGALIGAEKWTTVYRSPGR